jgi:nucleoid-associated protein YgaU
VKPGECFWSIAEDVLTRHLGHVPTDAEIVPYWRRLIEANRTELAHHDNPDLIFPAQVFVLPAP